MASPSGGAPDRVPGDMPSDYPAECEADVLLADGRTAHVRPIVPGDAPALVAFHAGLSDETRRLRFFSPHPKLLPAEVERFTRVDYHDRLALVAELGDHLIAVARYDRLPGTNEAEVAFVVRDDHQGRGIGTLLLEHLALAAADRGIEQFSAQTLAHNRKMLGVFRDAGFEERVSWSGGVVEVSFAIAATPASIAAFDERERRAAVRSATRILEPASIAVIGASRSPGTIGHELVRHLLRAGFHGPVFPVNPHASSVAGVPAFASVLDIASPVELAVVAVPTTAVEHVVEECGQKAVSALVVVTGGLGDAGERHLVRTAHAHGMRVVGPNCMGVLNTDAAIRMNATLAPVAPPPGPVAVASQSGALGRAVLEEAARRGLGISSFVSMGDKADVSSNDLLRYWEEEARTRVILLYLESFGNPRAFARIARRVAKTKPIVAVKGGRRAPEREDRSHTAALATGDVAVDALFAQTGVIRVDTLQELFEVASVLAHQPLPGGRRVAVVANAGGPGVVAADACASAGLFVPALAEETLAAAAAVAAAVAVPGTGDPVELPVGATAAMYRAVLEAVLADPGVDAVLFAYVPPLVDEAAEVAQAAADAAAGSEKPLVASFLGLEGTPAGLSTSARTVPSFRFPESAARALARAAGYRAWRDRAEGTVPELDVDAAGALAIVSRTLANGAAAGGTWLDASEASALVAAYGIPLAGYAVAADAGEAVVAAERLGYPVALKAAGAGVVHKTEAGGVHLGLSSAADVAGAFAAISEALGERLGGVLVQSMVAPGLELIAGVTQDPVFGPLVLFGAGGTAAELLGDRAVRVVPLTDVDALELVGGLRTSPLLFGYRGRPGVDVDALQDLLLRLGLLAADLPAVAELDLNPIVAGPDGVCAVDVKVRVEEPAPGPPGAGVRRLRSP